MDKEVNSGLLEFSDDQKVFVALDEDNVLLKAVLIDREGNETSLATVTPTDEQVQEAIDAWLDDHPEATTTVQDGAITTAKLADGSVTDDKLAADGIKAEVSDLKTDLDEYADIFTGDVDESVKNWLDEHPEATTTVEDGSLTEAKFTEALKLKTIKDYVTPEMFGAKGDGTTDDSEAIKNAIAYASANDLYVQFLGKRYLMLSPIVLDNTRMRVNLKGNHPFDNSLLLVDSKYGWESDTVILINSSFFEGTISGGSLTSYLTGEITGIFFKQKDSSIANNSYIFKDLNLSGFKFDSCLSRWIIYPFYNCYLHNYSYVSNNLFLNVETLINGTVSDTNVKNNYISGNATATTICFDCEFYDSFVLENFIDYFKYVYTGKQRILSRNNTYEIFGNLIKTTTGEYNISSVGDLFSGYSVSYLTANAPNLVPDHEGVFLISALTRLFVTDPTLPNVSARGYLISDAITEYLYPAYGVAKIEIKGIQMLGDYLPLSVIDINHSYRPDNTNYRPFIDIDILPKVDSLPTSANVWNGMKVVYNGNLYIHMYAWKQLTS